MISRSQPILAPDSATVHTAVPERWLSEIVTDDFWLSRYTSGPPDGAARNSMFARAGGSLGRWRQAARARFAVQRRNRQSLRRLAKRMLRREHNSLALNHRFSARTSASACSRQYTFMAIDSNRAKKAQHV